MPKYKEIEKKVIKVAEFIDDSVQYVEDMASKSQGLIDKFVRDAILQFEINDGHFVSSEKAISRILSIEKKINEVIYGKKYQLTVKDFLQNLNDIQDRTIDLHKFSLDKDIEIKTLSSSKKIILEQAENSLLDSGAIAQNYIDPFKRLLLSNVVQNRSIKDTIKLLEKWSEGELSSGRLNKGMPSPNLQRYATQMARDSAYSVNRVTNNIIKEEYGLDSFIYVGNLVADSRPLCKYLVNLNRPIEISEMSDLIGRYPEGLFPSTTKDNFVTNCGGYGCRHIAHSV